MPARNQPEQDVPKDGDARSQTLFQSLYRDLRALAGSMLRDESPGHTLPPTGLVHEAFIRLSSQEKSDWKSRSHFFAAGAMAMRRILVDHARKRRSLKRGGDVPRVVDSEARLTAQDDDDVLLVHEALEDLERLNKRHSQILELRFFGGLTEPEIAEVLGVSERTVRRDWQFCRSWLRGRLKRRPAE